MLILKKPGPKPLFLIKIGLFQSLEKKLSSKKLGEKRETLRLWQFSADIKIF